jgi:septin family protein
LVLGGTGQGKTTFLNFLANVVEATASLNGVANCRKFNEKGIENKIKGKMSSKTSDARTYTIKIGYVTLTIIDTPGFGDTRGTQTDDANFKRIKEAVLEEGGINCICVV